MLLFHQSVRLDQTKPGLSGVKHRMSLTDLTCQERFSQTEVEVQSSAPEVLREDPAGETPANV